MVVHIYLKLLWGCDLTNDLKLFLKKNTFLNAVEKSNLKKFVLLFVIWSVDQNNLSISLKIKIQRYLWPFKQGLMPTHLHSLATS